MTRESVTKTLMRNTTNRHGFAWRHELCFPKLGIKYTYIPKNGCSTLKKSLGTAEGWLDANSDPHDISVKHRLMGKAMTRHARMRFVVLRDPIDRFASAFLDRFLKADDFAANSFIATGLRNAPNQLATVTFAELVNHVAGLHRHQLDPHFRPQADFVSGRYTDTYMLHELSYLLIDLSRWGVDAQIHSPHATSGLEGVGEQAHDITVAELRNLRSQGILPSYSELASPDLSQVLTRFYADDLRLINGRQINE